MVVRIPGITGGGRNSHVGMFRAQTTKKSIIRILVPS
jgi:hypothetical protein